MTSLRLYKKEKLCSLTAINRLFSPAAAGENKTIMAYPWRAVWHPRDDRDGVRFLISVPKKKIRHAVDRVKMRRRCREAYRLSRHLLADGLSADIAFIYVAQNLTDYTRTLRSVEKILTRMSADHTSSSSNSAE